MTARACCLLLLVAAPAAAQYTVAAPPPPGFDRARAQQDTRKVLEALVRTDTRNPPGNELMAAALLADCLAAVPGVTVHILEQKEQEGARANFIARLAA